MASGRACAFSLQASPYTLSTLWTVLAYLGQTPNPSTGIPSELSGGDAGGGGGGVGRCNGEVVVVLFMHGLAIIQFIITERCILGRPTDKYKPVTRLTCSNEAPNKRLKENCAAC